MIIDVLPLATANLLTCCLHDQPGVGGSLEDSSVIVVLQALTKGCIVSFVMPCLLVWSSNFSLLHFVMLNITIHVTHPHVTSSSGSMSIALSLQCVAKESCPLGICVCLLTALSWFIISPFSGPGLAGSTSGCNKHDDHQVDLFLRLVGTVTMRHQTPKLHKFNKC